MSKVLVEDTNLTAIGNALREGLGETRIKYEPTTELINIVRSVKTCNALGPGLGYMTNTLPDKLPFTKHFSFPGASSI